VTGADDQSKESLTVYNPAAPAMVSATDNSHVHQTHHKDITDYFAFKLPNTLSNSIGPSNNMADSVGYSSPYYTNNLTKGIFDYESDSVYPPFGNTNESEVQHTYGMHAARHSLSEDLSGLNDQAVSSAVDYLSDNAQQSDTASSTASPVGNDSLTIDPRLLSAEQSSPPTFDVETQKSTLVASDTARCNELSSSPAQQVGTPGMPTISPPPQVFETPPVAQVPVTPNFIYIWSGRGYVYYCPITNCRRSCNHGKKTGEFTNTTTVIKHLKTKHDITPMQAYCNYGVS